MADANAEWVEHELPEAIAEMQRVTSTSAVQAIVDTWGGRQLQFPLRFDPEHALVAVVGHADAVALIEHYAGDRVYIPKMEAVMRTVRNAEIRARFDNGLRPARLAAEYGLTERHIWSIVSEPNRSTPQDDLFGSD